MSLVRKGQLFAVASQAYLTLPTTHFVEELRFVQQ